MLISSRHCGLRIIRPVIVSECRHFVSSASVLTKEIATEKSTVPVWAYNVLQEQQRCQAESSVLIVLPFARYSYQELLEWLQTTLKPKQTPHVSFCTAFKNQGVAMLVDFQRKQAVDEFMQDACRTTNRDASKLSRVFHLRDLRKMFKVQPSWTNSSDHVCVADAMPQNSELFSALSNAENFSAQVNHLVNHCELTMSGTRFRFFVSSLMEDVFRHYKTNAIEFSVHPFGSTTNGFSKRMCDLDLELDVRSENKLLFSESAEGEQYRLTLLSEVAKLLSHCSERYQFYNINFVAKARVPLVKFIQGHSAVETDLVFHRQPCQNKSGTQMSHLLWIYSQLHPAVRPLVYCVRKWASCAHLTTEEPGHNPTNFQLLILTLFFLVAKKKLLPPTEEIVSRYNIDATLDTTVYNEGNALEISSAAFNIQELLIEFFEYYTKEVNFAEQGLDLFAGDICPKSSHSIYVRNPLNFDHNMCGNISRDERSFLFNAMRKALDVLQNTGDKRPQPDTETKQPQNWGLLSILDPNIYRKFSTGPPLRYGGFFRRIPFSEQQSKRVEDNMQQRNPMPHQAIPVVLKRLPPNENVARA